MKESFLNKPIPPEMAVENYDLENPDPKILTARMEEAEEATIKNKSFAEKWKNTIKAEVSSSGKDGRKKEYLYVHDVSPEKLKTEVPVVYALGWGADSESRKKHIECLVEEHKRRVITSDSMSHGISAEKNGFPAVEMEKMTALLETLRASGFYIKEDGTATGQVDLVAHSEGAIYSIMLAYFYPQLVRNLVLENPAGLAGDTNKGTFAKRWLDVQKQQQWDKYKEEGVQPENRLGKVLGKNMLKTVESVLAISSDTEFFREMLKGIKANGTGVGVILTTEDKFFPAGKVLSEINEEYFDYLISEDGTHDSTYYEPEKYAGIENKITEKLEAKKEDNENAEQLAAHFAMHPEQLNSPADLGEAGPEIVEFESMVASFESTHSLAELHAIVDISSDLDELFTFAPILADPKRIEKDINDYELHNPAYVPTYKEKIARLKAIVLSPEDQRIYDMRMAARTDLIPIKEMLDTLKRETNISIEQQKAVDEKYKILTRAIGGIRKGKVDHDR
jgi:pimeloyl-ACP methyl ester carboxylesterase